MTMVPPPSLPHTHTHTHVLVTALLTFVILDGKVRNCLISIDIRHSLMRIYEEI